MLILIIIILYIDNNVVVCRKYFHLLQNRFSRNKFHDYCNLIIPTSYNSFIIVDFHQSVVIERWLNHNPFGRNSFRPNLNFLFSPKYDLVDSSFHPFIFTLFSLSDLRSKFWKPCRKTISFY